MSFLVANALAVKGYLYLRPLLMAEEQHHVDARKEKHIIIRPTFSCGPPTSGTPRKEILNLI